ncbi:MAG: hypothetical protein HYV28_00845 [Ignavibacteriales bacterium]|nr:hypothetical protein [Ignavibacteriales bacterium]
MQIKKYTASTLKEAIELMKTELGDEAIVLSTKVLEGRGANGGKVFEITAGMDNLPSPASRNPYNPPVKPIPKPQNDDDEPLDIALEELRVIHPHPLGQLHHSTGMHQGQQMKRKPRHIKEHLPRQEKMPLQIRRK